MKQNSKPATLAEQHFTEALLSLLQEKNFADISIRELAARAGYDRKTYYRHFSRKEDVLASYVATIFSEMAELMLAAGPMSVRSGFTAYFTFWERHIDFLQLLAKNDLLHFLAAFPASPGSLKRNRNRALQSCRALLVFGDLLVFMLPALASRRPFGLSGAKKDSQIPVYLSKSLKPVDFPRGGVVGFQ